VAKSTGTTNASEVSHILGHDLDRTGPKMHVTTTSALRRRPRVGRRVHRPDAGDRASSLARATARSDAVEDAQLRTGQQAASTGRWEFPWTPAPTSATATRPAARTADRTPLTAAVRARDATAVENRGLGAGRGSLRTIRALIAGSPGGVPGIAAATH